MDLKDYVLYEWVILNGILLVLVAVLLAKHFLDKRRRRSSTYATLSDTSKA
jgi:hypothetical protein